jgi:hypothetical protein
MRPQNHPKANKSVAPGLEFRSISLLSPGQKGASIGHSVTTLYGCDRADKFSRRLRLYLFMRGASAKSNGQLSS